MRFFSLKIPFLKNSLLMALMLLVSVSASAMAQSMDNTFISLHLRNRPLKAILSEIEKRSNFMIGYDNELDVNQSYSIDVNNKPVSEVLHILLNKAKGRISQTDERHILIRVSSPSTQASPVNKDAKYKNIPVSGTVTGDDNAPLTGVTVRVKGGKQMVLTDVNGRYSITAPENGVLVYSYISFENREITVDGRAQIDVLLHTDTKALTDVVVVGYGTQKKVNLTGAVSAIGAKELTLRPVGQTSAALQGVAPGVTVVQSSGRPGGDQGTIRIRGVGSLSDVNPLVLIDNVEGSLNDIDPHLIDNISVLKDAASSAIYGSRAANGVILVTTKRAKSNQLAINYNMYVGKQDPTNLPKMVDAIDHMLLTNEAYVNVGRAPLYSDDLIQKYRTEGATNRDLYPNTDWQKEVLTGSGFMQSHFISVTGGSDRIKIATSVGYFDQKGIIENSGFSRLTLRNNADFKFSDKLSMRFDVQLVRSITKEPGRGSDVVFHWMNRIPANQAGIYSNGNYGEGWNGDNPIAFTRNGGLDKTTAPNALVNASLIYKPLKWLTAEFTASPRYTSSNENQFIRAVQTYKADGSLAYLSPAKSSLLINDSKNVFNNYRATLTFNHSVNDHNFKLLLGGSREDYRNDSFSAYREGFVLPDYPVLNTGSAVNQLTTGSAADWSLQSAFGRFNYDYKSRYLFEVNGRYDGSSRFFTNHKYGFFPSVSAGWRLSEEDFFKPIKPVLKEFKIRGSWGRLGNQNIGDSYYPFTTAISSGSYTIGKQVVNIAALNTLANENISWETTEMSNIGADFTLFDHLDVTADYYVRKTHDILLQLNVPLTGGLGAPFQNAGTVQNKGWELGLTYHGGKAFRYDVSFNISDVKNKIIDLHGIKNLYNSSLNVNQEGYAIGSIYGLEALGFFQSDAEAASWAKQYGVTKAGDIKYKDQNGDGIINDADYGPIGSTIPRYTYSSTINLSYKGIGLNVFLQGVGKANGLLYQQGIMPFFNGGTVQEQHKDHWTPTNTNAAFPRFAFSEVNNEKVSSFWMKDASYLRFKNIQLSYRLPDKWLSKLTVKGARVYVNGQNLLSIDNFWEGYDVEAPVGRGSVYPQVKTYTIGLDINL